MDHFVWILDTLCVCKTNTQKLDFRHPDFRHLLCIYHILKQIVFDSQVKWAVEVYPAAAEAFTLNHSEAKVINLDCNQVLKIAMDGDEEKIRLAQLIKNYIYSQRPKLELVLFSVRSLLFHFYTLNSN